MLEISKLSLQFDVRRLHERDAENILRFCRQNTLYYEYCGAEPSIQQVLSDLRIAPPGVDMRDKYYVGFFQGGEMIAVLDLIDGYPDRDTGYIGFFMMNARFQGRQIGSGIIRDVCAYLKQTGKTSVRLGIAEENPQANRFWKKNGFSVLRKIPMDGWTVLESEKKLASDEEESEP